MSSETYVKGQKAAEMLGVHQRTLYLWEEKGLIETIRTPSNHRLYNVKKYLDNLKCENKACENLDELDTKDKINICYVRVSSNGQKDELERQKEQMVNKYPNHVLIEDIGSGLNLNKHGIKKIIKLAINGKVNELVVAYKDRLTRFGFELIEELITEYSNGKIIILNETEKIEPEEELVKDMMAIMNVYVAKMNGLRKYKLNQDNKK
jgi:predicted site-specific integrase-resolvase